MKEATPFHPDTCQYTKRRAHESGQLRSIRTLLVQRKGGRISSIPAATRTIRRAYKSRKHRSIQTSTSTKRRAHKSRQLRSIQTLLICTRRGHLGVRPSTPSATRIPTAGRHVRDWNRKPSREGQEEGWEHPPAAAQEDQAGRQACQDQPADCHRR